MKAIVMPVLSLTLILSQSFALSQELSPAPDMNPDMLTPPELRQILGQLHELRAARAEIAALREYITADAEIDAREKEIADQRLAIADEKIGLAEQTATLHKERADMYESTEINFVRGDCRNLPVLPGIWVFCPYFSRIYGQDTCVPESIPKVLRLFLTKEAIAKPSRSA